MVTEDTVKRYKSNLADEIEAAISELIQRAEQGLASLEKKQQLFESKAGFFFPHCDLEANVLDCVVDKIENTKMRSRPAIGIDAVQKLEARKLQTLTRQRERLEAEVCALEKEILELVCLKSFFFFFFFSSWNLSLSRIVVGTQKSRLIVSNNVCYKLRSIF